jgi:hypothetical protein
MYDTYNCELKIGLGLILLLFFFSLELIMMAAAAFAGEDGRYYITQSLLYARLERETN